MTEDPVDEQEWRALLRDAATRAADELRDSPDPLVRQLAADLDGFVERLAGDRTLPESGA